MVNLDKHWVENSIELKMFLLLNENQCSDAFPNMHVALRIYLYMVASNYYGERLFSRLKKIKNKLRNAMKQHRASALFLMSVEHDILRSLDFKDLSLTLPFARQESRHFKTIFLA